MAGQHKSVNLKSMCVFNSTFKKKKREKKNSNINNTDADSKMKIIQFISSI